MQVLDNDKSPLQLILEQQEKTRRKAESIADKIIEEIILQKSKQQMTAKLIKQQDDEITKLTADISSTTEPRIFHQQQQLSSSSQKYQPQQQQQLQYYLSGGGGGASTTSLDVSPMSRSPSQVHISQYVQRKNELLMRITNQIERNISEEQDYYNNRNQSGPQTPLNGFAQNQQLAGSFDNISQASRPSVRTGGSHQLNIIRQMNKSKNQNSPPQKTPSNHVSAAKQLNKYTDQEQRIETDLSNNNGNGTNIPLLNLQQANGHSFDLKEYMKQAILNQGRSKQQQQQSNQQQTTLGHSSEQTENTPAFNLIKANAENSGERAHISAFTDNQERQDQNDDAQDDSQDEKVTDNDDDNEEDNQKNGKTGQQRNNEPNNHFHDSFSIHNPKGESKQSHFKNSQKDKASTYAQSSKGSENNENEESRKPQIPKKSRHADNLRSGDTQDTPTGQTSSQNKNTSHNSSGVQNSFIAKINSMLQRSASINAQVEQSMLESEQNLLQIESLSANSASKIF